MRLSNFVNVVRIDEDAKIAPQTAISAKKEKMKLVIVLQNDSKSQIFSKFFEVRPTKNQKNEPSGFCYLCSTKN